MSGSEEEGPSEIEGLLMELKIKGGVAEEKYKEVEEERDSVEETESEAEEERDSVEEMESEAEEERDSVEETESSEFDEEDDDDDDEKKYVRKMLNLRWYDYEDYLAEGETKVDWEKWVKYNEQVKATEGFGLTVDVGLCEMAHLRPVLNFKKIESSYKFFCELSDLAIKKFNQDNIGKEFKLVDVEWVVNQSSRGIIYFLTFKAEDAVEGVKTFEAKVLDGILDEEPDVFLCRMKKQIDASSF